MNGSTTNEGMTPQQAERWKELCQSMGLLWHECGQDFSLFCYRIGYSAVTLMHSRAVELAPIPVTSPVWRTLTSVVSPGAASATPRTLTIASVAHENRPR